MRVQVVSLVAVVVTTMAYLACSGSEPTASGPAIAPSAPDLAASSAITPADAPDFSPPPDGAVTPRLSDPSAFTTRPPRTRDQQNSPVRLTGFVPLDNPVFIESSAATFLADDELVLGLEWNGEARAYPVRMMVYHHVVNDEVSGSPVLITY